MSTTDAAAEVHADGKVLLAVAEGNLERQPDEAMLAHIFSCESCGATLKEMRASLSLLALGVAPKSAPKAAPKVAPNAVSAEQFLAENLDLNTALDDSASYDAERRARSLIWKLAIIGGLLTAGLLWLQSSASSHV